jgi:TonB-linked SusC/RagA family outer membrane protein
MNVNFDAYIGIQNLYNQPEMLNAQQFMEIENEGRRNDGAPDYDYESIVGPYAWNKLQNGWTGTNWMDEMKNENSVIQNYALNITGGSSNSVYSFGASYHGNEGVFGKQSNSDFKRLSLRLNSEHTIFKNDNRDILKFGENLTYTNTDLPSVRLGNIYVNDVRNSIVTNPLMPVYDENGEYSFAIGAPYHRRANPVAMMHYLTKYNTNKKNKIVGNFYFDYQPIKDLVVRSSFGFQGNFNNNRNWTPAFELSEKNLAPYDKVHQSMYNKFSYTFTNTATYTFDIQEKNHFTALIGTEMNKVTQSLSVSGTNENGIFNNPNYAYLDNYPIVNPALTKVRGMDSYGHSILSYFGRISYNYDEKYMFTVVARADGSSNFAEGNRWGFFPSVSAGWVLSNESFLKDNDFINFMKLRASWGENGNQNIGAFQYSSTISYQYADYSYGPDKNQVYLGAYPARVPNPDITWETSVQSNIGVNMYFADSKLKMNLDWYNKTTKDWLVTAPIISSSGTDTKTINGGEVRNTGVEIALGYNDNVGDFKYGVTASFAYNDNEVVSIANDEGIIHGDLNVLTQGMTEMYRAQEGFPIGYFWGFETDGIIQNDTEALEYNNRISSDPRKGNPSPGDFRYKDINGDGKIDDDDKVMLGDPNPKYNFGLQLSLEYKNFYMNVTGTGQGGMQIAKSYKSWNYSEENYTIDVLDRWHGEGTSNTYPKLSAKGNQNMLQMSDFFVEDATYFRISNLTLGYSLPAVKGTIFKGGKVYVAAKNLITFTGYSGMDPEVGYGPDNWASGIDLGMYPQSRSFLMGINLSF